MKREDVHCAVFVPSRNRLVFIDRGDVQAVYVIVSSLCSEVHAQFHSAQIRIRRGKATYFEHTGEDAVTIWDYASSAKLKFGEVNERVDLDHE